MRRTMHSGPKLKLSRVAVGMLALLVAFQVLPPFFGLHSPFGWATGLEAENNPTACEAFGPNWTNCGNAFTSDNSYADAIAIPGGFSPATVVDLNAATATATEQSRKVFKNPRGLNNYYVFYLDDADTLIKYAYSSDGTSWTSGNAAALIALEMVTGDESSWATTIYDDGSQLHVYLVYEDDTEAKLRYRHGTIADASATITWASEAAFGGFAQEAYGVSLAVSSNGRLFVAWVDERNVGTEVMRVFGWDVIPAGDAISGNHNGITESDRLIMTANPTGTANEINVIYQEGTTILNAVKATDTGTGPSFGTKTTLTSLTLTRGMISAATDTQATTETHVAYRNGAAVEHRTYNEASGFSGATSVLASTPDSVSLAMDETSTPDEVFVFYVKSGVAGDVFFKTSPVDTISFGGESRIDDDSESIDYLSASMKDWGGDSKIPLAYTTQSTFLARFVNVGDVGPGIPGKNDTAWRDFGFSFDPSDTIDTIEIGLEWFRTSSEPVLNVTISWDGGSTWATNQTATNKSADDDTAEFLNFTSATAWTISKLSDANLRVRVGTNASDARLDHVTVRVNYNVAPSISNFRIQQTGSVQTQRDPAGCEAVGDNWTNCQDAFSSNDLYAYANGSLSTQNWGDTTGEGTSSAQSTVRYMGGTSPNIAGMTLKEVHAYYDGTGTLRLSVYQGGALDNPVGASLVWDAGTVATSGLGWYSITGGSASLTANDVTWIGFKSDVSYVYDTSWDSGSDFQSVRGRWESTSESNVPTDAWSGTLPTGGSFADFWYDVYLVYESAGGGNDTAWQAFDFPFASGDTINQVEIGVEWFRNNTAPVLDVTISWDGGSTWATSQIATNKSSDDDTVEFLDFTSATAWTASKLNDTNLRARASTNASGGRLDYTTVRVTSIPSRAGTQLDVDTEYEYLFNVTDGDGWSDIATDGNVSLNLWYDGNGTPATDQRDPTACAAIGNDWTNCQDAFSSNNLYAYANDSTGGGGGGGGAFTYITPVEVTPGTASSWVDVDVSAQVPSGATGVILHVVNNAGGDVNYGLRKPLSSDNRLEITYPTSHLWAMIGINDTQIFQANVGDITGMDLWLTGYTNSGVTFFTNAVDKSLGTTGSWVDIDISGDTGADTAIGAIVEIDGAWTEDYGLRMKGSSDNRVAHGRHVWAIVGVDGGEVFQGNITATTIDFFVVGYVTSGATFFTNAVDKSLTATASWLEIDISGDTGGNTANGAFIEVNGNQGNDYGLRKNGSTENILNRGPFSNWGFIEVDANEILEGQIADLTTDFYLVGYSLGGGGGANDFKVQRGQVNISTSQSTVTITAGTDYVAPASLSNAFIRIVDTFHSASGDDTGQGAPTAAQEWMTSISNPGNLLTSITFERYLASASDTTRIYWEILEYIGPSGGANEMIVRDQADIEQLSGTQMDGASATVTDDADVVIFVTGQRADGTNSGDTDRALYTAEWVAASDLPRFTRGDGTGTASVSYAVIEFTGANWKVQRAEHTYVASGVEETETITAVNSLSRTFLHAQIRTAIGNVDEYGHRVYLNTTTTVSFQLRSGAGIFSQVGVAWVVENTQTGSGAMNVQRVSGTRTGGLGNPDTWTETITAVADLSATSIMGETSDSSGTGDSAPRGAIGLNLTDTSTVTLWRTDGNNMQDYRFEVVEWPTAPSGGGSGGPGKNDTAWRDFGFSLSGSITMVEVGIEWWRNNTAPLLNVTVSWDGGTTWATNQTVTNKSADDDTVEWLDFTPATAWTPTKLNDANFRVRVGTNASGARLDYVTARVTSSSGELTFSQQTTGANYRIVLTYLDTADPTTAALSEWSVTEGRATYNASASGLTAIMSGPTIIGYEFRLALKFGFQVKHAVAPTNSTVGSYNDLDSWNGEVVATDGPHTITLQEASTGEHMEFGVFMYTFVNISGDWSVTVFHGQTANTNTVTVYRRSNDDFTLRIWFVTDLVKGGDTISITNVQILAAGDLTDDITADTAFVGLGEGNAVYILGSATLWFSHSTDTDEDTTTVQFSVTAPFGTPIGTYTAQLTIRIQQQP